MRKWSKIRSNGAGGGGDNGRRIPMATSKVETCLLGHKLPALEDVLRTFALREPLVKNVYVFGSHLWRSCNKQSDWDLVIVQDASDEQRNAHKGNMDAWIVSTVDYKMFIKEHLLQALITLWIPYPFVLLEKFNPRSVFTLSPASLRAAAEKTRARDVRVAKKHISKGDVRGGKKILLHCVRVMCFATQIKSHGTIIDYEATDLLTDLKFSLMGGIDVDPRHQEATTMALIQPVIDRFEEVLRSQE